MLHNSLLRARAGAETSGVHNVVHTRMHQYHQPHRREDADLRPE